MFKGKKIKIISLFLIIVLLLFVTFIKIKPINFSFEKFRVGSDIYISADKASLSVKDFSFHIKIPEIEIIHFDKKIKLFDLDSFISFIFLNNKIQASLKKSDLISILDPSLSENIKINFDGLVSIDLFLINPKMLNFVLTSNDGYLKRSNGEIEKLKSAVVNLNLANEVLKVNELSINYSNGFSIGIAGDAAIVRKNIEGINLIANLSSLPVNDLKYFWPSSLEPEIRKWVVSNIRDGVIESADAKFKFSKDDLKNKKCNKNNIDANIFVKGANLTYIENMKDMRDINAKVHIDCDSLEAEADNSFIRKINLAGIKFRLPFDTLKLEVSTKFKMPMTELDEFIPNEYQLQLKEYGLNLQQPNSIFSGAFELKYPLQAEEFAFQNVEMNINSHINSLVYGKFQPIKINNANLNISNSNDNFKINITNDIDKLNMIYKYSHLDKNNSPHEFDIEADYQIQEPLKFESFEALAGKVKVKMKVANNLLETKIDANNTKLFIPFIGFTKESSDDFIFQCSVKIAEDSLNSDLCQLTGKNKFSANIDFIYSNKFKKFEKLELTNVKIDQNNFAVKLYERDNISSVSISSKYLDLSKFDYSKLPSSNSENSSFNFSFDIDKVLCKNNITLNDVRGEFNKNKNDPPQISFQALSDGDSIKVSRALKNGKLTYIATSSNLSRFLLAANSYKNIKKGKLDLSISANRENSVNVYSGKIRVDKFYFSNNSALIKIVRGILSPLNSFSDILSSIKGGSLPADYFTSDILFKGDELKLSNGLIKGSAYEVKIAGSMNFKNKTMKFKGIYIPSLHGINGFIDSIPFLGSLITGGKNSAFIGANFSISGSFDNPETFFNPVSVLTPGFLRNIL